MKRKLIIAGLLLVAIVASVGIGIAISNHVILHPAEAKEKKKENKKEDKKEDKKEEQEEKKEEEKKEDNKERVTIKFNTNGGSALEDITVEKGMSKELPIPYKNGYAFVAWYVGNTEVDSNYKFTEDTTVTAKWKEETRTMKISFNTNGGSYVAPIVITCGKGLTLPKGPTKDGYVFKNWQTSSGANVFDGGVIKCANTTLYAKYEKQKVYTCPEGYTLSGTKCTLSESALEKCPDGSNESGGICIVDTKDPTKKCTSGTMIDNKCYGSPNEDSEEDCGTNGYHYVSGKCYTTVSSPKDACDSGYDLINSSCVKKVSKEKYCDKEDYVLTSGSCVKTIDATVKE